MEASPRSPMRPLLVGVLGFVVGFLVGWLLMGWVIWPVQYVGDAYTYELNAAEKMQYVAAVADSYSLTGQIGVVRQRFNTWTPEEKIGALAQLFAEDQAQGKMAEAAKVAEMASQLRQLEGWPPAAINQVRDQMAAQYTQKGALDKAQYVSVFAAGLGAAAGATPAVPAPTAAPAVTAAPQTQPTLLGDLGLLLRVCGVLVLILLVAVIIVLIIVRRRAAREAAIVEKAPAWTGAGPAPLMQWKSSYALGDDNFDMSSGIETEEGQYLGDIGMGIAQVSILDPKETPRRVMAFEVWLFDKGRGTLKTTTVTKVLMSDFAYRNEAVRKRLSSRGEGEAFEAVLAAPDATFNVETDFLVAECHVAEIAYGDGAPAQGYFKNLTVNFDIRQKGEPLGSPDLPAPDQP